MENHEDRTITIRDGLRIFRKRIWLITAITIICGIACYFVSSYMLKPSYESKVSIVIAKARNNPDDSQYNSADISMYQNLVKTYSLIAKSRAVADNALERLQLRGHGLTAEELLRQTTVSPQQDTLMLDISIKDRNPRIARDKAAAMALALIEEVSNIFPDGSIHIIDSPEIPRAPTSPNIQLNLCVAVLIGLLLSLALSLILEGIDNTVKTEADIQQYFGLPVLGTIPNEKRNNSIK